MNDLYVGLCAEVICVGCDCEDGELMYIKETFPHAEKVHYVVGTCNACRDKGVKVGGHDGILYLLDGDGTILENYEEQDDE